MPVIGAFDFRLVEEMNISGAPRFLMQDVLNRRVLFIIERKLRVIETALQTIEGPASRFSGLLAQRQLCKDLLIELQQPQSDTQKETT